MKRNTQLGGLLLFLFLNSCQQSCEKPPEPPKEESNLSTPGRKVTSPPLVVTPTPPSEAHTLHIEELAHSSAVSILEGKPKKKGSRSNQIVSSKNQEKATSPLCQPPVQVRKRDPSRFSTICRDGDYCCGNQGRLRAKVDWEKTFKEVQFPGCEGGKPPSCDPSAIGAYTTLLPCTPYELGRVRIDGWWFHYPAVLTPGEPPAILGSYFRPGVESSGRLKIAVEKDYGDLIVALSTTCPPEWVKVQSFWSVVDKSRPWEIQEAVWVPGNRKQGVVRIRSTSHGPFLVKVIWPSQGKNMYFAGFVWRPFEKAGYFPGLPLHEAWNQLGAMYGPYKDFRPLETASSSR